MLLLTALSLLSASAAPEGPGIDWVLSSGQISSTCRSELTRARSRVKEALATSGAGATALEQLIAVETTLAELDEALVTASAQATAEPLELIQAFLGRPPRPDGFLEDLGLPRAIDERRVEGAS